MAVKSKAEKKKRYIRIGALAIAVVMVFSVVIAVIINQG